MRKRIMKINQSGIIVSLVVAVFFVNGCGSVPLRKPLPEKYGNTAQIKGIPRARFWGDEAPSFFKSIAGQPKEKLKQDFPGIFGCEHNYLALSGGGSKGAYGAGLLAGWSAAGTRPEFTSVTGVSTGALMAPLVFLGESYDPQIKEVYTTHSTKDIVKKYNLISILTGSSAVSAKPLKKLIKKYVNRQVMEAIAAEFKKGRRLWIGTTNLDAKRPVIWNIGLIASSGQPGALELIHKIILASASIPAAFPPILIDVEADGERYDEIHVDGGTASQVFLYPAELDWKYALDRFEVKGTPNAFVIRNSFLKPDWDTVKPKIINIADQSITSLIRTQGIGDMYRIYLNCNRDGINFNLAYIPADFDVESKEDFDPVFMKKLFDLGFQKALNGYKWDKGPPGFE